MASHVSSRDSQRNYFEHDDRSDFGGGKAGHSGRRSRGRFNQRFSRPRGDNGSRNFSRAGLKLDDDGDIQMAGGDNAGGQNSRFTPYKRNRRRAGNKSQTKVDNFLKNIKNTWNKVTIPYGISLDKKFILGRLTEECERRFVPVNFHVENNSAVFFVEDRIAAQALEKLDRKIMCQNGRYMGVIVRQCPPPSASIDAEVVAKIKECMSRNYDPSRSFLDLRNFAQNPYLVGEGIHAPLARHNVFSKVVDIIIDSIPNIVILDLSNNKLTTIDCLSLLINKTVFLKVLILERNQLKLITEFDRLKGMELEELVLDGNPVCISYQDKSTYIRDIRVRFPKLLKLDSVVLPPPIKFAVDSIISLPTSQNSFFVCEDARNVMLPFLQQYFTFYDTSNKLGLVDAYHEHAKMSISSVKIVSKGPHLQDYISESRNLLKLDVAARRKTFLHVGRERIVACLARLPRTQHDPNSFSVDVTYFSSMLIVAAVNGVFKEIDAKLSYPLIRSFNRVFVITPRGSGFCIVNEMIFVTNADGDQVKASFKTPAPTPSSSPVPQNSVIPSPLSCTTNQQQQMVVAFSQQSGMNAEWALKCLLDNNWDYDKSAIVFSEINARGAIPPEAFLK